MSTSIKPLAQLSDAEAVVSEKPDSTIDQEAGPAHDHDRDHDHQAVTVPLERWNESAINKYRFSTTLVSFIIMGMNDGAVGV